MALSGSQGHLGACCLIHIYICLLMSVLVNWLLVLGGQLVMKWQERRNFWVRCQAAPTPDGRLGFGTRLGGTNGAVLPRQRSLSCFDRVLRLLKRLSVGLGPHRGFP